MRVPIFMILQTDGIPLVCELLEGNTIASIPLYSVGGSASLSYFLSILNVDIKVIFPALAFYRTCQL